MLYVYNECAEPQWNLSNRVRNQYRISLIKKPNVFIDIAVEENMKVNEAALKLINDAKEPCTDIPLLDANTSVRFSTKRLTPRLIATGNNFNSDFYIVSLDLSDGDFRLINQHRKNVYPCFQHYDYEKKQLHTIFAVNKKAAADNNICYIEFTLLDDKQGIAVLKNIRYSDRKDTLKVVTRQNSIEAIKKLERGDNGYIDITDRSISKYNYPLMVSIPMRPCKLIILEKAEDRSEFLKLADKKFKMPEDRFVIVSADNPNTRKKIKNLTRKDQFSACTYFRRDIDDQGFHENYNAIRDHIMNDLYGKHFENALVMCNNGVVRRVFL